MSPIKKLSLFVSGMLLGFVVSAAAVSPLFAQSVPPPTQVKPSDLVPRWSYGAITGLTRVAQDGGANYNSDIFGGLGAELLGLNWVNKQNDFTIFGFSLTTMMGGSSGNDEFFIAPGLGIKVLGNIFFGGTYDAINTNPNKYGGFATGASSWRDNGALWVSMVGPLNGGGALFNLYK